MPDNQSKDNQPKDKRPEIKRPEFNFTIQAIDGKARRGFLQTAWGAVDTPVFMPVGTA